VEEPRAALAALGAVVAEMPRHGRQSFCCGAGGAQMWKEEEPGDEAVSVNRLREALATGAQTVAVACPFCLTMLADAGKQLQSDVAVKDVVELAAERLCDSGS